MCKRRSLHLYIASFFAFLFEPHLQDITFLFFHGLLFFIFFFFFFSSRRRHTRWPRDWSSDVCSSDLLRKVSPPTTALGTGKPEGHDRRVCRCPRQWWVAKLFARLGAAAGRHRGAVRSEERRVGKEWRWRWGRVAEKEKWSMRRVVRGS